MSKFFTTLLLAITFVAATLTMNATPSYTTSKGAALVVDPVDLINGRINLTYEKKLNSKNSFTINASYWNWADWLSAFGVGASYRWYLDLFEEGKTGMNGLSVGPRADIFFWSYDAGNTHSYSTVAIGGEANYKWVFGDGKWAVEPTIKLTIPIVKEKGYNYYSNYGFGVNIGYCF